LLHFIKLSLFPHALAFEIFGPINQASRDFLSSLGHRLYLVSDDRRETSFLFQRLSVSIQSFNSLTVSAIHLVRLYQGQNIIIIIIIIIIILTLLLTDVLCGLSSLTSLIILLLGNIGLSTHIVNPGDNKPTSYIYIAVGVGVVLLIIIIIIIVIVRRKKPQQEPSSGEFSFSFIRLTLIGMPSVCIAI